MIPKRKLKPIDYVLTGGLLTVVIVLFVFLAAPKWLTSEGKMPSEEQAKELKADALALFQQKDGHQVPGAIQKLKPLSIKRDDKGVVIIFMKDSYQEYGYYYTAAEEPPKNIEKYCVKKITDGVYYYYVAW